MRNVYIITHPEATHHVNRVVGGWHDSQLTAAGERAASLIADELRARIPEDAPVEVFSSDLQRAMQTARVIAERLSVDVNADRRLREKSFGEAEGRPQTWFDERFQPPPARGERMQHDEGLARAETRGAFASRIYAAMSDILRSSNCENLVIVTHGFALTFVVAAWIEMPIESLGYVSFRAASGSISLLREDDYFHNRQLAMLGDVSHLVR